MHDMGLILTLTAGLTVAWVFGLITERLRLSPILGYLIAGIVVGPHTPGFVGDPHLVPQLAEFGVVLLMFGVGLHFKLKDLLAVKAVALPGALGQVLAATALGAFVAVKFGWTLSGGIVLGLAVSIASTVVLMRMLADNDLLNTVHGHIAVGWLIVEDLFTVLVLVLLPTITQALNGESANTGGMALSLLFAVARLAALIALVLVAGGRLIPALLTWVARMRSRELFTLTVLVVALGIATGSALIFGASMALGAFLAGMVVGQADVHHQAAADALPLRDAFAVLFFVSVGMLFDPHILIEQPALVAAVLSVILIGKPLVALAIVILLGHSLRTALTVAIGLAQIGEFSFILADMGKSLKLLPDSGHSVLIAAALISITLNPPLFRSLTPLEAALKKIPGLWRFFNRKSKAVQPADVQTDPEEIRAIVVGYGPVGRTLTRILSDFKIRPTIIDLNIDTVKKINAAGLSAIYGDAGRRDILEAAGVAHAKYLLVTLPDLTGRFPVIATAKLLNPAIQVLTRARYLGERPMLEEAGASSVAYEEAEVAVSLARFLLQEVGASELEIDRQAERVRGELAP